MILRRQRPDCDFRGERRLRMGVTLGLLAALVLALPAVSALVDEDDPLDPARNVPLPCGALTGLPSATPQGRSNRGIEHLANVCGIVGTDVELQSRTYTTAGGQTRTRDYAFVGTMGDGFRIYDVTNPAMPVLAGKFQDSGWQNDIQVRGDIAVSTFDGVAGEDSTASTCLKLPTNTQPGYVTNGGQGVDIFRLTFRPENADNPTLVTPAFEVANPTCVGNPPGGAHNATLHPSGEWLAISNPSSDWAVDVVDLRPLNATPAGEPRLIYRLIDESRRNTASTLPPGARCPPSPPATFTCVVMSRPTPPALGSSESDVPCRPSPCPSAESAFGLWRPHDAFFSTSGRVMYVAALNSTFIVDVSGVLNGAVRTISIIPNISEGPLPGQTRAIDNPRNIELSHQVDLAPTAGMLVIADERGGGVNETRCNTQPFGVIGGLHFWAFRAITGIPQTAGASLSTPKKVGVYFNPNPGLAGLPLGPDLPGRAERGCTVHVFRIGGNGTASPGPIHPAFDGVSRLDPRTLSTAWYGAGVWTMSFAGPPSSSDGVAEYSLTTWGNTIGWNVQPGADTWSAKEYKGFIYAGDILRGFDVYTCGGSGCPTAPRDPAVLLTKTGPETVRKGTFWNYTISYRNAGPAASQNARIVDLLPPEVVFVSATNGGVYSSATRKVTYSLGTVPAGASGSVTLRVRLQGTSSVPTGAAIVNRAEFSGDLTVSPPTAVWTSVVAP